MILRLCVADWWCTSVNHVRAAKMSRRSAGDIRVWPVKPLCDPDHGGLIERLEQHGLVAGDEAIALVDEFLAQPVALLPQRHRRPNVTAAHYFRALPGRVSSCTPSYRAAAERAAPSPRSRAMPS